MKPFTSKTSLFLAAAILCTVGVYLFIPVATQKDMPAKGGQADGMQAPKKQEGMTMEGFKKKALEGINQPLQGKIKSMEDALAEASNNVSAKSDLYAKLAAAYSDGGVPEVSAWYIAQKAALAHTAQAWETAGDNYAALAQDPETKDIIRPAIYQSIIDCYDQAVKLDPNNNDLKVKLGEGYMEGSNDVMQGVQLLLQVVRADSNHYMANLILGKNGIKSGQYEKAIARLEKVISLQSEKPEGYFLLVDAYAAAGRYKEAAETLKKARPKVKDRNLQSEIDKAIQDLSNKN